MAIKRFENPASLAVRALTHAGAVGKRPQRHHLRSCPQPLPEFASGGHEKEVSISSTPVSAFLQLKPTKDVDACCALTRMWARCEAACPSYPQAFRLAKLRRRPYRDRPVAPACRCETDIGDGIEETIEREGAAPGLKPANTCAAQRDTGVRGSEELHAGVAADAGGDDGSRWVLVAADERRGTTGSRAACAAPRSPCRQRADESRPRPQSRISRPHRGLPPGGRCRRSAPGRCWQHAGWFSPCSSPVLRDS